MLRRILWLTVLVVLVAPGGLRAFEWSGRLDLVAQGLQSSRVEERSRTLERLASYPPRQTAQYTLRALDDEAVVVRVAAARLLGRGRVMAAVPPLTEWLTAQEEEIRTAACRALGRIGATAALLPVAQALNDTSATVRQAAVEALGLIGTEAAVSPLVGRLGDSHPRVRQAAAQGLGQVGAAQAIIPLVARLQDPVQPVRVAVIGALARLGEVRAAAALVQSLRDPSPEVRTAALNALARIRPDRSVVPYVVALLEDNEPAVRTGAVAALGALGGEPAAVALIEGLGDTTLVDAVVEALVAVGEPAVEPLCQVVRQSRDDLARTAALRALVRIGSPRAGPAVLSALEERRGNLPETALLAALGAVVSPAGLLPLLERTSAEQEVPRLVALASLSAYVEPGRPDPRVSESLLERVRRGSAGERLLALILLAQLRDRRAVPLVVPRLRQERHGEEAPVAQLRAHFEFFGDELRQTLLSLEATGAAEQVAALRLVRAAGTVAQRDLLLNLVQRERNAAVRYEAAVALGEVGGEESIRALLALVQAPPPVDRVAALRGLARALRHTRSAAAISQISALVTQAEPSLALRAADTLARIGDPLAVDPLATMLERPEVDYRRKAVDALGELGGDQARSLLLGALRQDDDPVVRGLAAWALGKVGGPEVAQALVAALDDPGWSVRTNAAGALARLANEQTAPALCQALAGEPRGAYRGNLLLAAAASGAPCALSRALELFRRPEQQSHLARGAAIRVAAQHRRGGESDPPSEQRQAAEGLLRNCLTEEPHPGLQQLCRQLDRQGPAPPPAGEDWLEFVLYAEGSHGLRRQSRFLLLLPQGLVKAGVTDAHGWAREAPVPAGEYEVQDASVGEELAP